MCEPIDFYLDALKANPRALSFIPKEILTPDFYTQAFEANPNIFIHAIKTKSTNLLNFPKESITPAMYIEAIGANPCVFKLIDPSVMTREMCLYAIKNRSYQLKYVPSHIIANSSYNKTPKN